MTAPGPYRHFADRLHQRFGLHITPTDYDRLCQYVTNRLPWLPAYPAHADRLQVALWYGDLYLRVIYAPTERVLVTVLSPLPSAREREQIMDRLPSNPKHSNPRGRRPYQRRPKYRSDP